MVREVREFDGLPAAADTAAAAAAAGVMWLAVVAIGIDGGLLAIGVNVVDEEARWLC